LRWNLNKPLYESELEQEQFDLINSRFLADGINEDRWRSLVRDCWRLLVPGGWLQMVEPVWAFQSDFGQVLPCLEAWWNHYAEALKLMQKDARAGRYLFDHMRAAEFQSITLKVHDVPAAGWKDGMSDPTRTSLVVSIRD
jgi:SAM-dependent methyltransferase